MPSSWTWFCSWFGARSWPTCFRLLGLAITLAASPSLASPFDDPAAKKPPLPNILLAIGDNWSYRHAGVHGDKAAKTPHFDQLCQQGVRFRHAFCPVPSCSPTRACLLTGRIAHQLEDAGNLWSQFSDRWPTFTRALAENGYEVGYTGKGWGPGRFEQKGRVSNPVGPAFESLEAFLAAANRDAPFFFWLGDTSTAFGKWERGAGERAHIDPKQVTVPAYLPDVPEVRSEIADYLAAVQTMDQRVGEAIALLQAQQRLSQTIVIYTSDNGWQMPHGLANCYDAGLHIPMAISLPEDRASQAKSPATSRRVVEDFVSLTDLAPTILQWAGLDPAKHLPGHSGQSLIPLLGRSSSLPSEADGVSSGREGILVERERHANVRQGDASYPIRGIRTRDFLYLRNFRPERWPAGDPKLHYAVGPYGDVDPSRTKKYILEREHRPEGAFFYQVNFGKRPAEELYDLRQDPDQVHNVAGQPAYIETQQRLAKQVVEWMQQTHDPRAAELAAPATPVDVWDTYPYLGPPHKPPQPAK